MRLCGEITNRKTVKRSDRTTVQPNETEHAKVELLVIIFCLARIVHPSGYALPYALLEGEAESAVAAVAAFAGQLLGNDRLSGSGGLLIEADEVVDAQIVNIGIVSDALTGEILAEIGTVGANRLSQLLKGQVVLQVKPCVHAMLSQQLFEV